MIIDFRVRPQFRSFALDPKRLARESDKALEDFVNSTVSADITKAVVMGRFFPNGWQWKNEDVLEMCRRYPELLVGFGSVDVRNIPKAVETVDKLADLGFRGIAFESGSSSPALFHDDPSLFPVYERVAKRNMIIGLTGSGFSVPNLEHSNPLRFQKVAQSFPETPVVIPHACWPWLTQAIGAITSSLLANDCLLYLIPDNYINQPSPYQEGFVEGMTWKTPTAWTGGRASMSDRFLFASSFPGDMPGFAVKAIRDLGLGKEIEHKFLYENAAKLLGLT